MNTVADIKFSLVLCTVGRPREVERLFASLAGQTHRNFELFITDQNSDDCMLPIIERYRSQFSITHIRSPLGLSKGRNMGIRKITGDVMALPDDDCVYEPDTLARVAAFFHTHPNEDGIAGTVPGNSHWSDHPGPITRHKLWWQGVDFTLFFRRAVIEKTGLIDERLGLGSGTPWQAGECIDYMLRVLQNGFSVVYDPSLQIAHPGPFDNVHQMSKEIRKALGYSTAIGHMLRVYRYELWFVLYMLLRPSAGLLLSLCKFKFDWVKLYANVIRGVGRGYLQFTGHPYDLPGESDESLPDESELKTGI